MRPIDLVAGRQDESIFDDFDASIDSSVSKTFSSERRCEHMDFLPDIYHDI